MPELAKIQEPTPLAALTQEQLVELQTGLALLGYPVGTVDGLLGPKTRNAWAEFVTDVMRQAMHMVGPLSLSCLQDRLQDLDLSHGLDFSTKAGTIEAICHECRAMGLSLPTQQAYVIATTDWETAHTFKPVKEAFWLSEAWRQTHLSYYPYYGRGYVQLTWEENYAKYGKILALDLVGNPNLALVPTTACFILVHGFKTGTFTGRMLTEYVDAYHTDFVNARRCINGVDHAEEIAALAEDYLEAMQPVG